MDETRQTEVTPIPFTPGDEPEVEYAPSHGRAGFIKQIVDHLARPRKPPAKSADTGVAKAVGDYWEAARKQLGLRQ